MRTAAVVLAASLSGCATLFHGAQQEFEVTTRPRGAVVALDGRAVGITPARLKLDRSQQRQVLRLDREGFRPDEVALDRRFNWWSVAENYGGWFLLTFLYNRLGHPSYDAGYLAASSVLQSLYVANASFAIDALTGAVWKLSPRAAEVELSPVPVEPPPLVPSPPASGTLAVPAPAGVTAPADSAPAR